MHTQCQCKQRQDGWLGHLCESQYVVLGLEFRWCNAALYGDRISQFQPSFLMSLLQVYVARFNKKSDVSPSLAILAYKRIAKWPNYHNWWLAKLAWPIIELADSHLTSVPDKILLIYIFRPCHAHSHGSAYRWIGWQLCGLIQVTIFGKVCIPGDLISWFSTVFLILKDKISWSVISWCNILEISLRTEWKQNQSYSSGVFLSC